jgi:diguanylate cyclase (GGDEF)-like protein/PAS domain S-box-containing protein
LKLTTSLGAVNQDLQQTRVDSIKILLSALLVIIGLTLLLVRRSVTRPINEVSKAMVGVSSGLASQDVPVLGRDELAQMAGSFNLMTSALSRSYHELENEQNKLATIILTAGEGIIATNAEGQVVLVNPALVELLDKSQRQLEQQGLTWLLDDPALMNSWLEQAEQGHQSHVVEYHNKLLNVVVSSIKDEQGRLIGSTAFVRDVTTEKRLEAELRQLSITDGLTGLHNRRYYDEVVQHEIHRSENPECAMSLLLFDIDYFKRFNDTYGHDQGDRVLQQVAKTLKRCVRAVDIPCRYGGEEFVVILPNTDVPGARVLAERVRKAIEQTEIDGLKVTVSIGVAHRLDYPIYGPDQLLEAADQAMYQAKEAGRNRVVVSQPASEQEHD